MSLACEVAVVGLGAAGGLAAMRLAQAGIDVVGFEAGTWLESGDFAFDDIAQMGHNVLGDAKANHERPMMRASADERAVRMSANFGLMANAVGGAKLHASTLSFRLSPWSFRMRSATIDRYGDTAIPAGATVADWPFGYDELEPWYDEVERLYGVAGTAGNVHDGPRSGPYPSPPLRQSGYTRMMHGAAQALGWNAYPAPAAVRTLAENGNGSGVCTYCGFCTFNGCWNDAKGLVSRDAIPTAQGAGLRVETDARVVEILVDGEGRACGVAFVKDGERRVCSAKLVVLATYVYENVRLLLVSRSSAFPNGLANTHGRVGRDFMAHSIALTLAHFPSRRMNIWTGTAAQATATSDFDADNFDHSDLGFIGGSTLMAHMEARLPFLAALTPPHVPRWGAAWKAWLARELRATAWAYAQPEPLPYATSCIDLDPVACDRHGIPVVRVTYDWGDNEWGQVAYLRERLREWFEAAGAEMVWHAPTGPAPVSTHAYGGTRMGDDAATSVVDRWGMAHDVPGLAVLGASTFPSAGGVNPTETVEALALRTADHIVRSW